MITTFLVYTLSSKSEGSSATHQKESQISSCPWPAELEACHSATALSLFVDCPPCHYAQERFLQVTPPWINAPWTVARASPACHHFAVNGKEQILNLGGGAAADKSTTVPIAMAVILELNACPPVHVYDHARTGLQARLKQLSKGAFHPPPPPPSPAQSLKDPASSQVTAQRQLAVASYPEVTCLPKPIAGSQTDRPGLTRL